MLALAVPVPIPALHAEGYDVLHVVSDAATAARLFAQQAACIVVEDLRSIPLPDMAVDVVIVESAAMSGSMREVLCLEIARVLVPLGALVVVGGGFAASSLHNLGLYFQSTDQPTILRKRMRADGVPTCPDPCPAFPAYASEGARACQPYVSPTYEPIHSPRRREVIAASSKGLSIARLDHFDPKHALEADPRARAWCDRAPRSVRRAGASKAS